jgi:hypothetical protein
MKKLLLATAISAVVFTGQASAVIPTTTAGAVNEYVDFTVATGVSKAANVFGTAYFTGSSAANAFLESAIKISAAPNTKVFKYYDSSKAALTYFFSTGASPTAGFTANKNYVVHKLDKGGSVTAIMSASTLAANKLTVKFNQTLPTVAGSFGKTPLVWPCTNPTLSPTAGVIADCTSTTAVSLAVKPTTALVFNLADVDASQFASVLNGATTANKLATLATAKLMPSTALATQTFGVAVTLKLRNAMQKAMIASGALPDTCTVGSEIEACMASFTSADLTALFSKGRLTTWKNLRFGGVDGQNLFEAQADADKPGNPNVHICSRAAGSGTLAAANLVFENAPCVTSNEAIQSPAVLTSAPETGTAGFIKVYHAATSTGELENCLETMDGYKVSDASFPGAMVANGTFPLPTLVGTGNFRWAVGIMNTDKNTSNTLPYRFVKINGFSPSAKNVAKGVYTFWSELSLIGVAPTAITNPLAYGLLELMKDPLTIAKANKTSINFGVTGYLATAPSATFNTPGTGGTLINAAFEAVRPVNPFTHADMNNTAGSVNHCRVANVLSGAKALPGLN